MGWITRWAFLAAVGAAMTAGSACAAEDDTELKTLVAECGGANVNPDDIDSCLERARVMGEANPSPQLQTMTAKLERQAEQLDEDEKAVMPADEPEPSAQGGTGTPVATGGSAAMATPHAEMH